MRKIPLIKPYITQAMKDKVMEVLDSGFLTEGPVTRDFENEVKNYIRCEHALAVCNCTVGLEMALRAVGVGPGDEVVVPDYTYPATADAVNIVGATTVLVDVSPQNMLIDYDALELAITSRTKAILPVSLFGNPLDWDRLNHIRKSHNLFIIEDAACSLGAEYKGQKVGYQADISVFSLHPRKFITTGEGGLVTTTNKLWADWMISYKNFGLGVNKSRLTTTFDQIGTNYKLSDVLSAIGLVQMRHIDDLLARRRMLAQNYISLFSFPSDTVSLPQTTLHGKHSYQSFCVYIKNRDEIINKMRASGIETQIGTYSLHMHQAFTDNPHCRINGDMSGSIYAFEKCLTLPLYHDLTRKEQRHIVEMLKISIRAI